MKNIRILKNYFLYKNFIKFDFIICLRIFNLDILNQIKFTKKVVSYKLLKHIIPNIKKHSKGFYLLLFINKNDFNNIIDFIINNNLIFFNWIYYNKFLYYLSINNIKLNNNLTKSFYLLNLSFNYFGLYLKQIYFKLYRTIKILEEEKKNGNY